MGFTDKFRLPAGVSDPVITKITDGASAIQFVAFVSDSLSAPQIPSTSLSGGISHGNGSQGGTDSDTGGGGAANEGVQWSQNAGLALSWKVDLFGHVGRTIAAASADTDAAEAVRDAVRVTIVAETTQAYHDAYTSAYALAIAQESVQTSSEILRLVSAQEHAGSVGRLEVERAGAAVAVARARLAPHEAQRQVAMFELAALTGRRPQGVPTAARTCSAAPGPVGAIAVGAPPCSGGAPTFGRPRDNWQRIQRGSALRRPIFIPGSASAARAISSATTRSAAATPFHSRSAR